MKRCTTCGGVGTVPKALPNDGSTGYGFSAWPQESCQACGGTSWIASEPGTYYAPQRSWVRVDGVTITQEQVDDIFRRLEMLEATIERMRPLLEQLK